MAETESAGPLTRLREAADKNEGTAKLADAVQDYVGAKASSLVTGAARKLGSTVERLTSEGASAAPVAGEVGRKLAQGKGPASAVASGGVKGIKEKAKQALGGGSGGDSGDGSGGGKGQPDKGVNIVEDIDVGVPVRVAYNQWTRFPDFANFTKGVQSAEKEDETTSHWTGKVLWSSRNWKGRITEQVQDERIAWSTEAAKGTMKGVVTFHPLGENLTKVLLVVEYYPQGFFEKTGNIWRAQGRRLRLDLKHYRRQVMMLAQEEAREVEGWRGEIREGETTLSHEDAMALEEADLSEEQWAELEELDEDEAAELAELDPREREELAAQGASEEEPAEEVEPEDELDDESEEAPEDGRAPEDVEDEEADEPEELEPENEEDVEYEVGEDEYPDEEERPDDRS